MRWRVDDTRRGRSEREEGRPRVWVQINHHLKRRLPRLHAYLKRRAASWQAAPAPAIPVLKRIRGEWFWVHPRVLALETEDAEPHICRWILANLPVGGVFFDVGANLGWLSLKAARHVGRDGRIVSFEASPVLSAILSYHQRRNHLPQMTVVGKAVSEADACQSAFYLLHDGFSTRNSLTIGNPNLPYVGSELKTTIAVPLLTLDSFCSAESLRPDVVKIDVEGAELMVLRGSSRMLRDFRPTLVLSVHPFWLPPSQSVEQIFVFLTGLGYKIRDSHVVQVDGYTLGDYLLSV